MRGQHAGQGGGQSRSCDQHAQAALARRAAVLGDGIRLPMRGAHLELVRNPARLKFLDCALHALAIRFRADHDADDRIRHA